MIYTIELLQKHHNRASFDCGAESLNAFIKQFARQNSEKGLGRTFVAVLPGDSRVYGYYTIASGAVRFDTLPKKLPPYPIPVVLLGRLAVDNAAKGQKLGEGLLLDALKRGVRIADQLGIYAVEVYALSESARVFYQKYGFIELSDDRLHLHLPIKTIKDLGL
ncbi:MAG TPA: GNAT family N-acetyltransferase [Pyrinomonadaceae bacterium]|nr:GNAT family N-acetyltransferase [Pyrinomonadaceae bacterium]